MRVRLHVAASDEDAEQDARHVGVENRGTLAEREASDRACRVLADPFEGEERLGIRRQLAVVSRDRLAGDCVQPARPDVVAERPPCGRNVHFGCSGERFERRIFLEPLVIFRQDPIDLRLLQHDLRDQDVVRVGGVAPRKVAAVSLRTRRAAHGGIAGAPPGAAGTDLTSHL